MSLPDRVVLAAHHAVHVRGPDARQVGLDPSSGVVLEDLCPALTAMVDELGPGVVRTGPLLARARAAGADPTDASAVLAALVRRGLLHDADRADRVARRREAALVVVRGDGPLALGTAAGLARAGVGGVLVRTSGTVARADLVVPGLGPDDLGRDRAAAAFTLVERLAPVRVTAAVRQPPDLVVLTDAQARHPDEPAALVAAGVEHLAVAVRDGRGIVGPLVLPGRTACLGCLDLVRTERDPGWPALVSGLIGDTGSADPAVVAATTALGVTQALLALDGNRAEPPPTLDATVELDPQRVAVRTRRWSPHPACRCGAADRTGARPCDAPCGATAGRGTIDG